MKVLEEIDGWDGMVEREAVRWRDEVEGSSPEARLGVVSERAFAQETGVKGERDHFVIPRLCKGENRS